MINEFARIAIRVGVNLRPNQILIINSPVECYEFVRILTKEAYDANASNVIVRWNDCIVDKEYYVNASNEALDLVPSYITEQLRYAIENDAAILSISSPNPGLLADVDSKRIQRVTIARNNAWKFYHDSISASKIKWSIISYPNYAWSNKVFPNLSKEEGFKKLLEAILASSRIDENSLENWEKHSNSLKCKCDILNKYDFDYLWFKNAKGTDLKIWLADEHNFAGGSEESINGEVFMPNIPTEEVFGMPNRNKVFGTVYSTKPLNYQGKLIDEFYLKFDNGKVVEYDAKVGKDALENLLSTDEGSSFLGEVALISYDTPISKSNILFLNTLFDENASCHLALGSAYPMNIKGGTRMQESELVKKGMNDSLVHVDFMFGSSDLQVYGYKDGVETVVFKHGNFSI